MLRCGGGCAYERRSDASDAREECMYLTDGGASGRVSVKGLF